MDTDAVEQMHIADPLIRFSAYSQMQFQTLLELGQDILKRMDQAFGADPGRVTEVTGVYGQFWLWLLGAYEVVRTMCQAKECFSATTANDLKSLKDKLAELRMPFAKQEFRGEEVPVGSEPSVSGIIHSPADMHFEVKGQTFSARGLIGDFSNVLGRITRSDVLADHRESYK